MRRDAAQGLSLLAIDNGPHGEIVHTGLSIEDATIAAPVATTTAFA